MEIVITDDHGSPRIASSTTMFFLFLTGFSLVVLLSAQAVLAQSSDPLTFSEANFEDSLIRNSVGNLFMLIEGAFGALIMVAAGLIAIIAAGLGQYRAALGMLVVAVGAFILRALVSLFFGTNYEYYQSLGSVSLPSGSVSVSSGFSEYGDTALDSDSTKSFPYGRAQLGVVPGTVATVKTQAADLRRGPSIDDPIIFEAPKNTRVQVVATVGDWVEVANPDGLDPKKGKTSFVQKRNLSFN